MSIISILLIVGGLVAIFYFRTKMKNSVTEIKFMQTKPISELKNMFSQMDENGLGSEYREYVELKGKINCENLVETPFSNRKVAYCDSKLYHVTERREQYRDSNGHYQTRTSRDEYLISDEQSSQYISLNDDSCNDTVILDINGTGCKLDIPKTFDRLEPKGNLGRYRYFQSFSWNRFGSDTIGLKMVERTIDNDQSLYVIGEAYREGNKIHIGKPQDSKKPFIVTTRSEEDLVNTSKRNELMCLIGGIIAIVIGIYLFFNK